MPNLRRPTARTLLATIALVMVLGGAPTLHADDPNPVITFDTPLGSFDVELFLGDAPVTVANFLKYVEDRDYTDSFIHRSVPGFVIQGGGFRYVNGNASTVPADPPIVNEFKRSNTRGTIAMAKVDGDPNSATSQWFINLVDNSSSLDGQNGGFTVFGQVVGDGMQVVDSLAGVPTFNTGGAFTALPLINYTAGNTIQRSNLLITDIGGRRSSPVPTILLRRSTNRSWLSYQFTVDETDVVTFEHKGSVKLTRSAAYETVSRGDFDGDGEPDALLRDTSVARAGGWILATLDGKTILDDGELAITADADWDVVSTDDFDDDDRADLLLRNRVDGTWMIYLIQGHTIAGEGLIDVSDDLTDTVVGIGDFDGDGRSDVLLRRANGSWLQYLINGAGTTTIGKPKITSSARAEFEALADFDGDGRTDVLVRDNKGRWTAYMLKGAKIASKGTVAMTSDLDFALVSTADFNGDGTDDALLRSTDGAWILYTLDGKSIVGEGALDLTDDLDYSIVAVGDFDRDGSADLLLRNSGGDWLLQTIDGEDLAVLASIVPKLATNKTWVPQIP